MCQWDLYVEHTDFAKNHPLVRDNEEGLIQYKQPNEKSYARFREMMQLIDCVILDVQTLQYKPRTLIASFMYMTLGKYFNPLHVLDPRIDVFEQRNYPEYGIFTC